MTNANPLSKAPPRIYTFPMGEDEAKTRRDLPWRPALAILVGTLALAGVAFLLPTVKTVPGVVTASRPNITAYADEVKAADEAKKVEAEKANLASLESEVQSDMSNYFAGPSYGFPEEHVVVLKVTLVKTSDTQYEGTAKMSARGGEPHDILVHVTADDRSLLWKTDDGALLPLFYR